MRLQTRDPEGESQKPWGVIQRKGATYTIKTRCEPNLGEDLANEVSEDLNKNKFRSQRSRPVWNDHENKEGMIR